MPEEKKPTFISTLVKKWQIIAMFIGGILLLIIFLAIPLFLTPIHLIAIIILMFAVIVILLLKEKEKTVDFYNATKKLRELLSKDVELGRITIGHNYVVGNKFGSDEFLIQTVNQPLSMTFRVSSTLDKKGNIQIYGMSSKPWPTYLRELESSEFLKIGATKEMVSEKVEELAKKAGLEAVT